MLHHYTEFVEVGLYCASSLLCQCADFVTLLLLVVVIAGGGSGGGGAEHGRGAGGVRAPGAQRRHLPTAPRLPAATAAVFSGVDVQLLRLGQCCPTGAALPSILKPTLLSTVFIVLFCIPVIVCTVCAFLI